MNFDTDDILVRNSSGYKQVTSSIRRVAGLEEVWTTCFSEAKSIRDHLYDSLQAEPVPSVRP